MKVIEHAPPRVFRTGRGQPIDIADCARIALAPDEQVTFVTESGGEYDVARKAWGFYATPSLNGRLLTFGLRAALVRSFVGKYYVLLVEHGREGGFEAYLRAEDNTLVRWLDNDVDLAAAGTSGAVAGGRSHDVHCMCGADRFTTVHMYFDPPKGEVPPLRTAAGTYRREIFECRLCGHFISTHDMGGGAFYDGEYVNATYGDLEGIRRHFERVIALPAGRSDNAGRVRRVDAFARLHVRPSGPAPSVLDVGSGLCVFLHGMKAAGWEGTALDPDERAARHARDQVGVSAIAADFLAAEDLGQYDLVTFNKVIEHVKDPVAMLRRAARCVAPGGLVYVELPDGEAARADAEGFGREEFFIEHYHVFSAASAALLAARAGFEALELERLREPSSKYTIRIFLRPLPDAAISGAPSA